MKDDEQRLLEEIQRLTRKMRAKGKGGGAGDFPYAREVAQRLGIHEKRAYYIFCKWTDKGWYDSGVSEFAGWLTEKGLNVQVGHDGNVVKSP
jgi:hypothetical protein